LVLELACEANSYVYNVLVMTISGVECVRRVVTRGSLVGIKAPNVD
jgi:hypothetical protein